MSDNIFFIPVLDNFLLYAPLQGVTALMNESAVVQLSQKTDLAESSPLFEIQREFQIPPVTPTIKKGEISPLFFGFITTRSCNLSCSYCGFGASTAPARKIPLDEAMAAVDWMVENTLKNRKKELNIHFFGGEPFVSWDLVEAIVHKARWEAAKYDLVPHFEASTNGVLPEKRARFVGDYFDVVVLSLDGFKEFHDRNRPISEIKGSFELVCQRARLWGKMPVKLCLRMCVTQESVSQLEEIGQWYCEEFEPNLINFDTLQDWPKSIAAGLSAPDPYEFASHFIRAREIIESYGVEAVYAADYSLEPHHSFCPVGKDAVMLTPDGKLNGCYLLEKDWQIRGLDFNLGEINNNKELEISSDAINRLRKHVVEKPSCETCFCKWSCAGGCHVNHSYPNASLDPDFCIQTRIITACSLLRELNEVELAKSIINDQSAMQNLSKQATYSQSIVRC